MRQIVHILQRHFWAVLRLPRFQSLITSLIRDATVQKSSLICQEKPIVWQNAPISCNLPDALSKCISVVQWDHLKHLQLLMREETFISLNLSSYRCTSCQLRLAEYLLMRPRSQSDSCGPFNSPTKWVNSKWIFFFYFSSVFCFRSNLELKVRLEKSKRNSKYILYVTSIYSLVHIVNEQSHPTTEPPLSKILK